MNFLKQITVEPGIFFTAIGFFMYEITFKQAVYTKICFETGIDHYNGLVPPCFTSNLTFDPQFHDKVSEKNAAFTRVLIVATVVTPCLSTLILSAWGDVVGRKVNILLGTTGLILEVATTIIVIGLKGSSIWTLLGAHLVFGCLGIFQLSISSSAQYITDIVADKRLLALRMTIVVALMSIGITIGNVLAAETIQRLGYGYTLLISLVCLCTAFLYFLFMIEQVPPSVRIRQQRIISEMSVQHLDSQEGLINDRQRTSGFIGLLKFIAGLLADIWHTYTKPRPHGRRFWLFTIILAYFFLGMGFQSLNSLLVTYTRDDPLDMSPKRYGIFGAAQGLAGFFGSIIASALLRYLHVRDTTTLMLSLISITSSAIVYATATTDKTFFIAAGVGCLGWLGYAVFQSFVAQLVAPEEVGKVLAGETIVMSLANIVGSLILNSVYKHLKEHHSTLRSGPILVAIGFDVIAFAITVFIHIGTRKLMHRKPSVKPAGISASSTKREQVVSTIEGHSAQRDASNPSGSNENRNTAPSHSDVISKELPSNGWCGVEDGANNVKHRKNELTSGSDEKVIFN